MREFDVPIGRVWRRLRVQRFLQASVWCGLAGLLAATAAIGGSRLAGRPLVGPSWWPLAAGAGLGLLVAGIVAALGGPSRLDAAAAIDRAFGLHERLATAMGLPPEVRASSAGNALIADTIKHVGTLDVRSKFNPRLPRLAWLPLLPAAVAAGLIFAPAWAQQAASAKDRAPEAVAKKEAVAKANAALGKSIAENRKKLDKAKFAEADKLLAEIEKAALSQAKGPTAAKDKDKALVDMNKLKDAVKDRQKQLGGVEQMSKQLANLQKSDVGGPADKFNRELARGDFQQAADEMKQLAQKLADGKLGEPEKKELAKQLGEMKQQLEKLADMRERKKQLDDALKNGGITKEQHEKQMQKLAEQAKDMKQLKEMAKALAEAQKSMSQGDLKKAAEALGATQQQLEQLAQQAQEMQALDGALADIQDAKEGMQAGEGQNQMGEGAEGMNSLGKGDGTRKGNGNNARGKGRGAGNRDEATDDVDFVQKKVKLQYGKGKAILEGLADPSKTVKGQSVVTVNESVEAAGTVAAEALTNQKVPKAVEKHVLGYFDQIRKGD